MSDKQDSSLKAKPVVVSKAPKPITPLRGSGFIRRPPACPPEWLQWAMMDRVEAWEAAALSINLEPRRIDPGKNSSFPDDATYELFKMRVRIVEGAPWPTLGRNQFGVSLPDLAAWAVSKGLDIPSELASMARPIEALEVPEHEGCPLSSGAPESDEPTATTPAAINGKQTDISWQEQARAIADGLDKADSPNAYDSISHIAERVASVMREKIINGPRGPLLPGTILREALQGGRWKRKR